MSREEWAMKLPFITAFAEGKKVEYWNFCLESWREWDGSYAEMQHHYFREWRAHRPPPLQEKGREMKKRFEGTRFGNLRCDGEFFAYCGDSNALNMDRGELAALIARLLNKADLKPKRRKGGGKK